ncbi:MAG TPA: hypothetical protein VHQ41_03085 [Patescibacteria group bacterium]|jgi:murein DD-endopeptidase MepM/ murein hydrolase activator NlpD|nr:hypothetical protein [Patescibacteria group bacterium]
MNLSNIPRNYLLGIMLVMVVVLIAITAFNPGSLIFKDNTDYNAQKQLAAQQAKEYQDLLDSVQPDYAASQQLLEKIATEDVVREQVETALDTKQKVVVPTVATSELVLAPRNDKAEVSNYINRLGSMVNNYNQEVQPGVNQTFADNADASVIATAAVNTKTLADNIRGLPVPKDAVEMQKAYLVAYQTYGAFLGTAANYARDTTVDPWSNVYNQYSVIDNRLAVADSELTKLTQKFALDMPDSLAYDSPSVANGFGLIKTAHAQLAVIDVKAVVEVALKAALARAFSKFAISMLDKLVGHIEKNFAIASQLYYSNDLGRYYSVEYMKKFVADPLDQDIIQKFLPQYFCVNPQGGELKKIFTAKAMANQGSDLIIDPSDPNYLQKLARLGGDQKNYPNWWEDYYTTLAQTTQQQASSAATKEVVSPGLKSGRDLVTGEINKTLSSIFNVQEAAITGTINLGTNNTENLVGQLVSTVVESMVNRFVFTPIGGGTSSGGGIGVIGSTDVCLKVPKMKPIAALPSTAADAGHPAEAPTH